MHWTKAATLTLTTTLIGCSAGQAASASAPPIARLVAYSHCMRAHGVPSFPDPDRQGNLVISPAADINPGSPQYKRAASAGRKLAPGGSGAGMTPAEHAKALAAMTRYAKCMRRHGVPMANPFSGPNGGVGIAVPRSVDPQSALYLQADAACKHLLPNG
jgi:hypothetical protein